ncbi:MAG: serine/threonine-protein kinase [Planctomycetota bacterium]|jgi:serine/threonine protein kinase
MTDYQQAVQTPALCFSDPQLQHGTPVLNRLGLPRPICGQFASVYEIKTATGRWAAKCLLRNIPDLHERYARIAEHLSRYQAPYFVTFEYQPAGIYVHGNTYPLVKMEWFDGITLNQFVENNLSRRGVLHDLERSWTSLLQDLRGFSVAHGDLQHGNVMVGADGRLRLIDYDGMWVPALDGQKSHEIGHPNFQSPQRTEHDFDPRIDRFSGDVIRIAIRALARKPALWRQYDNGDNLLFRRADFLDPARSSLFNDLRSLGDREIRTAIDALKKSCGLTRAPAVPGPAAHVRAVARPSWTARRSAARTARSQARNPKRSPTRTTARPSWITRRTPAPTGTVRQPASAAATPTPIVTAKPPASPVMPASQRIVSAAPATSFTIQRASAATRHAQPGTTPHIPVPSPGACRLPLWQHLLGFLRIAMHTLLLGPVAAVALSQVVALRGREVDEATAILVSALCVVTLFGLVSTVSLYVVRTVHRTASTLFFGFTAVVVTVYMLSSLLTTGSFGWAAGGSLLGALMLWALPLSAVAPIVEVACQRAGVITTWGSVPRRHT